ncbi:Protein of unknown function [Lactobacillus helveticus CIRM-BIA 101]|uniref:Uncharacterized protein n=2 Tax=Lactobacillus helveticus TaxID=1587 RepID=U4QMH7_LACHE|nr:Protein of unknown function [Lactobacillus helveticus CIRM-BIA 953]CDI60710.1 Protein of unknown function [Lactobacillus helveticus CIRM-BIA 104]CDI65205.1 Protein of unknown function [Lactobacillus helveticus CIRM-BIA 101]
MALNAGNFLATIVTLIFSGSGVLNALGI